MIGGTSFMQQRMMPPQGDPAQQKMMQYLMPGMFTVFMLFLPSGLGVYMFTNGVIPGILQQQLVERHVKRQDGGQGWQGGDRGGGEGRRRAQEARRGQEARAEEKGGDDDAQKISEGRPLLDKGRA